MGPDLEKAIRQLSLRMRLLRAAQEDTTQTGELTERDILLMQLLKERQKMTISEIAAAYPNVSESTISMNVTKLWRKKKMVSKTINPDNQRVTVVELTEKGEKALELVMKQRADRFNALFHAIQVTDDERNVLIRVCNRAVEFMDKHLFKSPAAATAKSD